MSGDQFLSTFTAAIAPRTIATMQGKPDKIMIQISNGSTIEVSRKAVRDCASQAELDAYVAGLVG